MAKSKKDEPQDTNEIKKEETTEGEIEEKEADGMTSEETEQNSLETQLAAEKDKYLRLAAEYDNYRKRSAKERENLFNDIRSDTIVKILPVYDNLERALKLECSDEAFYKGIEMTMNQLKDVFSKLGITEIPAVGEIFDPTVHNAVMHVEDDGKGESEIVEEFQKGFKMGDKVIRFSMVKVAN